MRYISPKLAGNYGTKYYWQTTNQADDQVQLEILERDYVGGVKEMCDVVGCSLNLDGVSAGLESPVTKTTLTFSVADTYDIPDTAAQKHGNWQEFFTPDATKYLVRLYVTDRNTNEYQLRWSGYVTPDSYQEELDYRGIVTITCRDHIGHMSDFEFDLPGDQYGLVSIYDILDAAAEKVCMPMWLGLNVDTDGDARGIYAGAKRLDEAMINISILKDRSYGEILEDICDSFGYYLRYIDRNTVCFGFLRNINLFQSVTEGDIPTCDVIFQVGGIRMYDPAYKRLTDTIKYEFNSELAQDHLRGLNFTGQSQGVATSCRYRNALAWQTFTFFDNMAPYDTVVNSDVTGWFGSAPGWLNSQKRIFTDEARFALDGDPSKYAFLLTGYNNTGNTDVEYRLKITVPRGALRISFAPGGYLAHKNDNVIELSHYSRTAVVDPDTHLMPWGVSSARVIVRYEVEGVSYWWDYENNDWSDNEVLFNLYSDDYTNMNDLEIPFGRAGSEVPSGGRLFLGIHDIFLRTSLVLNWEVTTNLLSSNNAGIYCAIKGVSLVTASDMRKLSDDTVTTINDDAYNVKLNRTPAFAALSVEVPYNAPFNYPNGLFYYPNEGDRPVPWPYVNGFSGDVYTQPLALPALVHRQLLMFHHVPMEILEGDVIVDGQARFDQLYSFHGLEHIIAGGVLDLCTGRFQGLSLRTFVRYNDLWEVPMLDVSPRTVEMFAGESLSVAVHVSCNGQWEIVDLPADLTASPSSGTGNGDVILTSDAITEESRSTITVRTTDQAIEVPVNVIRAFPTRIAWENIYYEDPEDIGGIGPGTLAIRCWWNEIDDPGVGPEIECPEWIVFDNSPEYGDTPGDTLYYFHVTDDFVTVRTGVIRLTTPWNGAAAEIRVTQTQE